MRTIRIITALSVAIFCMTTAYGQKDLLSSKYTQDELAKALIPLKEFHPYPTINQRGAWESVEPELRDYYISAAEKNTGYRWPALPATLTLEFVRDGNRSRYEDIHFGKRKMLIGFLLGEIMENRGRFVDDIINGVWSICEESYWGVPAHLKHSDAGEGLPDVTAPFVDLFAAETARNLALISYLMGDRLDEVSPEATKRISLEIERRVLTPVLTKKHMWMDFASNWNTWICASWLTTALLAERDEAKRTAHVEKIISCLDTFLNGYPEDGGCDEGPGYWYQAGGAFYECLDMMNRATDGNFDFRDNQKVRNIGTYITRSRLTRNHIINFADSRPFSSATPSWVYFCGKMIGDRDMMGYGLFGYENEKTIDNAYNLNRRLDYVLNYAELKEMEPVMPFHLDIWMDRIQVMTARDREGTDEGFVVAAKMGSNTEGHNHNDVGGFMAYYDGIPVLIDVGSGTYTARTFNDYRYNIWFNSSAYHNLPEVNGTAQVSRGGTHAKDVKYAANRSSATLSGEIAPAYPEGANVSSIVRTVSLKRGQNVSVGDRITLTAPSTVTENFMTCVKPDISQKGKVLIPAGDKTLILHYDAGMFEPSVEKIVLDQPEDIGVKSGWGDDIHRISLTSKEPVKGGNFTFRLDTK